MGDHDQTDGGTAAAALPEATTETMPGDDALAERFGPVLDELRATLDAPVEAAWHELPAEHYRSAERLEAETRALFRRLPLVAAHASELPAGSTLARDVGGVPIILARDAGGRARAFVNACRHRASRLCDDEAACARKAMVCRYHGWTYDLAGALLHAPHAEVFAGLDPATRGLVPVPLVERHGLLWAIPDRHARLDDAALADQLRELDGDLAACALADQIVIRRATSERRCNWKLVIDAFLEGYHIRRLHRDSVGRFFLDAHGAVVAVGPHVRAVSARRTLVGRDANPSLTRVRDLATPSFLIFPNTVLILHPDYTSVLVMTPLAVDRVRFEHSLIVPRDRAGAAQADHYAASFELIEGGVFQAEDLAACEAIQRGLEARADDALVCGGLERAVPWFHDAIAREIARARATRA